MSGAIGIEQLKKLPSFIEQRRKNAEYFVSLFGNDDRFIIQQEIGKSSWFGFSLILSKNSGLKREDIVKKLDANQIECRPIVTGNFLKNQKVLQYFDYEVAGTTENADWLDTTGLFVGNHQIDLTQEITLLRQVLD